MTTQPERQSLTFYPPRYFDLSPTYHSWAKLTAAGVHALRKPPPGLGHSTYISSVMSHKPFFRLFYYLNHPIRFVRVVGTVVEIGAPTPLLVLFTLDDGSGATVEVKLERLRPDQLDKTGTHESNTVVPNVRVESGIGFLNVLVDGTVVDIGTVLRVQCSLDSYRQINQLELKQCSVIKSTADEIRNWVGTAKYMRDILQEPWVLSAKDQAKLDRRYSREQQAKRDKEIKENQRKTLRQRAKEEWYRVRDEKKKVLEEKLERRRQKEEVLMNRGALV
ncbi:uncharacterized protein J3D65DRAFT_643205 [Phyllosticta citribraziliensis]|uniref:CST complex subunit Stn1 N-terminal domain-containing protein n=1 Tax=Phyllosticta citribraziliensis TaxID=989973 RepID=A0ABR1L1P7_9PEZI